MSLIEASCQQARIPSPRSHSAPADGRGGPHGGGLIDRRSDDEACFTDREIRQKALPLLVSRLVSVPIAVLAEVQAI